MLYVLTIVAKIFNKLLSSVLCCRLQNELLVVSAFIHIRLVCVLLHYTLYIRYLQTSYEI